ncbi:MAG: hypothetical protein C4563_02430 [Desulfobulbus sp.]|jgi:hypothetical protein|nr:MAG: hypothetical protein C4563_02430 [Desulfobulbus sp.]
MSWMPFFEELYVRNMITYHHTLLRHEKDYMLRLDHKYIEKSNFVLDADKENVHNSVLTEQNKQRILKEYHAYKDALANIAAIKTEIDDLTDKPRDVFTTFGKTQTKIIQIFLLF